MGVSALLKSLRSTKGLPNKRTRQRRLLMEQLETREVFAVEGISVSGYNGFGQEESNLARHPFYNRNLYDIETRFSKPVRQIDRAAGADVNGFEQFVQAGGPSPDSKRVPNLNTLVFESGPIYNASSSVQNPPIQASPTNVSLPTRPLAGPVGPVHQSGQSPFGLSDHLAPSADEYSFTTSFLDVSELKPQIQMAQLQSFTYGDLINFALPSSDRNNSTANFSSNQNVTLGSVSYVLSNSLVVTKTLQANGTWSYKEDLTTAFTVTDTITTTYSPGSSGTFGTTSGQMNRTLRNQGSYNYVFFAIGNTVSMTSYTLDNKVDVTSLTDVITDTITSTGSPSLSQTLNVSVGSSRRYADRNETYNIASVAFPPGTKSFTYKNSVTDTWGYLANPNGASLPATTYRGTMNQNVVQAGVNLQAWRLEEKVDVPTRVFSQTMPNVFGTGTFQFGNRSLTGIHDSRTTLTESYNGQSQGKYARVITPNNTETLSQTEYWVEELKYSNASVSTQRTAYTNGTVSNSTPVVIENKNGSYWKLGDHNLEWTKNQVVNGVTTTSSYKFYSRDIASSSDPLLTAIEYSRSPNPANSSQVIGNGRRDNLVQISKTPLGTLPSFVLPAYVTALTSARNSTQAATIASSVNGVALNSSESNQFNESVVNHIDFTFNDTYSTPSGVSTIARLETGKGFGGWANNPSRTYSGSAIKSATINDTSYWSEYWDEKQNNSYGDNWNYWYRSDLVMTFGSTGLETSRFGTIYTNTNPILWPDTANVNGPVVRPSNAPSSSNLGFREKHKERIYKYDWVSPIQNAEFHTKVDEWIDTKWTFSLLNMNIGILSSNGTRVYHMRETGDQGGGLGAPNSWTSMYSTHSRPVATLDSTNPATTRLSDVTQRITYSSLRVGTIVVTRTITDNILVGWFDGYSDRTVTTMGTSTTRTGTFKDTGASYVRGTSNDVGTRTENSLLRQQWNTTMFSVAELTYNYLGTLSAGTGGSGGSSGGGSSGSGPTYVVTGSQTTSFRAGRTGYVTTWTYGGSSGGGTILISTVTWYPTPPGPAVVTTSTDTSFLGPRSGRSRIFAWTFDTLFL